MLRARSVFALVRVSAIVGDEGLHSHGAHCFEEIRGFAVLGVHGCVPVDASSADAVEAGPNAAMTFGVVACK